MNTYSSEKDHKQHINQRLNNFTKNNFYERDTMITPRSSINTRNRESSKFTLARDLSVPYLQNNNPYATMPNFQNPSNYKSKIQKPNQSFTYNTPLLPQNNSKIQRNTEPPSIPSNNSPPANSRDAIFSNNYSNMIVHNNKDSNNKRLSQLGLMRNTSTIPLFNNKRLYDLKPEDTRQRDYKSNKKESYNYQELLKKIENP
jgi:hypothetical protein